MDSSVAREKKHFFVSLLIQQLVPNDPVELVEIESVSSKATQVIAWRELQNEVVWQQAI